MSDIPREIVIELIDSIEGNLLDGHGMIYLADGGLMHASKWRELNALKAHLKPSRQEVVKWMEGLVGYNDKDQLMFQRAIDLLNKEK